MRTLSPESSVCLRSILDNLKLHFSHRALLLNLRLMLDVAASSVQATATQLREDDSLKTIELINCLKLDYADLNARVAYARTFQEVNSQ